MSETDLSPQPNQLRRYRRQRLFRIWDVICITGHASTKDYVEWEHGRKLPSLRNALKLSVALDCPVEILFIELLQKIRDEAVPRKQRVAARRSNNLTK